MNFIADIFLVAGALGAAFYCFVLSRRLRRLNDLEGGMGSAVAMLSAQVDDMTRALERARSTAHGSGETLETMTARAETVAQRLELLVASMHDLPSAGEVLSRPASFEEEPAAGAETQVVWRRHREAAQ